MKNKGSRALSLSFHGGTGTGKNYVSKIIAENMYRKGMDSKYVHLISAAKDYVEMMNADDYSVSVQLTHALFS